MVVNMIVGTHYIDCHKTHFLCLHIPFCIHIKNKQKISTNKGKYLFAMNEHNGIHYDF